MQETTSGKKFSRDSLWTSVTTDRYGKTSNAYYSYGDSGKTESSARSGVSLENYLDVIKRGDDATTSFDGTRRRVQLSPGNLSVTYRGKTWYPKEKVTISGASLYATWPSAPAVAPAVTNEIDDLAKTRIFQQIRAQQTAFTSLTFLGELGSTISMIRNPAAALRKNVSIYMQTLQKRLNSVQRVKKHKKRYVFDLRKVAAETWLEAQMGWLPLISDIRNAVEALERLSGGVTPRTRFTAMAKDQPTYSRTVTNIALPIGILNGTREEIISIENSVRYVVGWRAKIDVSHGADLRLFGLNWAEVPITVYELIPFSFLLDYFVNLGKVIEAVCTATDEIVFTCRTERRESSRSYIVYTDSKRVRSNTTYDILSCSCVPEMRTLRDFSVTRRKATLTVPSLHLSLPQHTSQWLNIGALKDTAFRTKNRYKS